MVTEPEQEAPIQSQWFKTVGTVRYSLLASSYPSDISEQKLNIMIPITGEYEPKNTLYQD